MLHCTASESFHNRARKGGDALSGDNGMEGFVRSNSRIGNIFSGRSKNMSLVVEGRT